MEQNLQLVSKPIGCASDVYGSSQVTYAGSAVSSPASLPATFTPANLDSAHMTFSNCMTVASSHMPVINTTSTVTCNCVPITTSTPASTISASAKQLPSVCSVNVAPYKIPVSSLARRAYTSPTFLIRNGNKVQCVMVPPKSLASPLSLMSPASDSVTAQAGSRVWSLSECITNKNVLYLTLLLLYCLGYLLTKYVTLILSAVFYSDCNFRYWTVVSFVWQQMQSENCKSV